METLALIFTSITAFLHGYFFVLETFLWTTPIGLRIFHMKEETAKSSKVLAANQGIYNGMLALGLLVSFFLSDAASAMAIRQFCLFFIIVVGCYGSYSLKNFNVLVIQALPAMIAFVANRFAS